MTNCCKITRNETIDEVVDFLEKGTYVLSLPIGPTPVVITPAQMKALIKSQ